MTSEADAEYIKILYIASNLTLPEIAKMLHLSKSAVKSTLKSKKVFVENRLSLAPIGTRFNHWKVVGLPFKENNYIMINALCDCGIEKVVRLNDLKSNKIKSCGCHSENIDLLN